MKLQPHQPRPGYLAGPIVIADGSGRHDLRVQTWNSSTVQPDDRFRVVEHESQFVLLVEKKNIFDRLIAEQFHLKHRCLLATGHGYPRRHFWAQLRTLHDQLRLPLYVLADNDPPGYLLFFVIARGTARRHSRVNEKLAIPEARYLGVRADDFERLGLPESANIDLGKSDYDQLAEFRRCDWLSSNTAWQHEINQMSRHGFKVELEAVYTFAKGYLANTYLPERLAAKQYLRL